MNLFKALSQVPVGHEGFVSLPVFVNVEEPDGSNYRMKLRIINRINNEVEFRMVHPGRGSPVRNFYWERVGPDSRGDFLNRCVIISTRYFRKIRNSLLEITVHDPGRTNTR